ncbi:MAG: hypothetical protein WKG01_04010 [Kofleriaceae bacterium]
MVRKVLAPLLMFAACSAAHADQPLGPQPPRGTAIAIGIAPVKVRAPYDVQVIREGGETAPTYALKDRFYVQGNAGERYTIRVTNPTPNRVEAVITVDGLDVIDGESGDLRKRGYVVLPYGETRIEGFRTSQADVATFRFSTVDESYAGKKGKARNVGVIAVAIFEENAPQEQQVIVGDTRADYDDEGESVSNRTAKAGRSRDVAAADRAPPRPRAEKRAPAEPSSESTASRPSGGAARAPVPPPPPHHDDGDSIEAVPLDMPAPRTTRPGLGTEYGEQRYSAASFTRFVRAGNRPVAVAELRYNDLGGLMALGINIGPMPDHGEIMTRETADPFPGDDRYARPPGR